MKGSYFLKAGFLVGLMFLIAGQVYGADPDSLYVRHLEGAVELAEAGSNQWMEAAVNTPLIGGDTVRTGPSGKAELFLKDGSVVRMGKNSTMRVTAVESKGVQFKLDRGTAYIVATGSKEVPLFFDTSSAALDVTTPATLRVDAYDGGISEVSVYKGEVYALQQKGRMPVRAGERLILAADSSVPRIAGLRSADEWLRWNTDRDRTTFAANPSSESYEYLPDELRAYSSDLDANGQWVYTPEYDYVWVPTVITVGSWSPYRFGRWVWILGNYVWVGYEPWGWAPYHYGRWVHHRHAGWCWVPPARGHVLWEPAHVAWVHSSRHVGWVPLAPGERYDRRTAPVIHQTNIYNTHNNVTLERSVSKARSAYKNAAVANSVVSLERDSMVRAKAVNVNVTKRAAVPLKTVSLPAGVMPARAKVGPVRTIDSPKTATGAIGQPRPATVPVRGGTELQSPQNRPKTQPVTTQKATQERQGGSRPAAVPPSLSTRIEGARTTGAQPDRQAPPRQPGPNTSITEKRPLVSTKDAGTSQRIMGNAAVSARTPAGAATPSAANPGGQANTRSLAERISSGRSAGAAGTLERASATPSARRPENPGLTNPTPQVPASAPSRVQARSEAVTTRPAPSVQVPAKSASTAANRTPAAQRSGSQGGATVRAPERRQPVASNNTPSLSAPSQVGPATVTTRPAPTVRAPAAPAVRTPEPPRQAAPRVEQRPAAVQKEQPQPQAARQNPTREKVDSPSATPAPASAPAAGGRGDNAKPASMNRGNGPHLQQSAAAKPSRN